MKSNRVSAKQSFPRGKFTLLYALWITALIAACGDKPGEALEDAESAGFLLQATAGTYNDGSGHQGLALLTTLRDSRGHGPREPWTATLSDATGPLPVSFSYEESSGAQGSSQAAWWWPSVSVAAGANYRLSMAPAGGDAAIVSIPVPDSAGLPLPRVDLSSEGTHLTWTAVPGAARYTCRVYSGTAPQLLRSTVETSCALDGLPPGNYSASVLAFSVDVEALAADGSQRPVLPESFHVSEGRLAFVLGNTAETTFRANAVGGALYYGRLQPGLALWLSLTRPDGTPSIAGWSVELVGPGLTTESPLRFTYPPGVSRHLIWSYDVLALEGRYALTARSGTHTLSATFDLVPPSEQALPTNVVATPSLGGGLFVSWRAVEGARAYYVSVWDLAAGAQIATIWTTTLEAHFGSQTFIPGRHYDVYVAAASVDISQPGIPALVSVSENTYYPQSFVAQ